MQGITYYGEAVSMVIWSRGAYLGRGGLEWS